MAFVQGVAAEGLWGQYWKNQDRRIEGQPTLTRRDALVDFDWQGGAPGTGVTRDLFAVRWTGQVAGEFSEPYTFSTTSDDGVRLWVGGVLVIDQWVDQSATEASAVVALTAGQPVDLVLEYYERSGAAVARLSWSSPSQAKQVIPASRLSSAETPPVVPSVAVNGVQGEYWTTQSKTFTGPPTLVQRERFIDFMWGKGSPTPALSADQFTARWTGQVQPEFSEVYRFATVTDDGVRLWVDGQLLIAAQATGLGRAGQTKQGDRIGMVERQVQCYWRKPGFALKRETGNLPGDDEYAVAILVPGRIRCYQRRIAHSSSATETVEG